MKLFFLYLFAIQWTSFSVNNASLTPSTFLFPQIKSKTSRYSMQMCIWTLNTTSNASITFLYFSFFFHSSEFEVPSLNFPGQVHLWKLSQFLQKGSEPTGETLLGDLALAAQFIVITARARVIGHFFSVKEAAKAFIAGLMKLIDMVVGVPSLLAHNLENKVKEERCRYLIAELNCRVSKKT